MASQYQKVLYDVSSYDFHIVDDDHSYEISSQIHCSTPCGSAGDIYWSTVAESGLITQQVSLSVKVCSRAFDSSRVSPRVILFIVLFVHLDREDLHPTHLLLVNALLGIIGLFLYRRQLSIQLRK